MRPLIKLFGGWLLAVALLSGAWLAKEQARAQNMLPLMGAGGTRGMAAPYSGPANVVASPFEFWGTRAVSLAYATGLSKLANICAPADALCAVVNSDASGDLNLAASGLGCNDSTTICTVETLYTQSGATHCTTACDMANSTIATRPTLVVNCVAGKPCLACTATQFLETPVVTGNTLQPFTYSAVGQRTGSTAVFSRLIGADGALYPELGWTNSSGVMAMYNSGSNVTLSGIAENTFHSVQAVFNDAVTDTLSIDGVSTTPPQDSGAGTISAINFSLCADGGTPNLVGNIREVGIWAIAFNGTQIGNMNTNQHNYGSGF